MINKRKKEKEKERFEREREGILNLRIDAIQFRNHRGTGLECRMFYNAKRNAKEGCSAIKQFQSGAINREAITSMRSSIRAWMEKCYIQLPGFHNLVQMIGGSQSRRRIELDGKFY